MKAVMIKLLLAAMCVSIVLSGSHAMAEDKKVEPDDAVKAFMERISNDAKIKEEYLQRAAAEYLKSAKKRFDERLFGAAEKDLVKALQLDPRLEGAQTLLAKVRRVLGKTGAGDVDMLSRKQVLEKVKLQYAHADMRKGIREARELLRAGDYSEAISKLEIAQNSGKVLARYIDVSREMGEINLLIDKAQVTKEKARVAAEEKQVASAKALATSEHERLQDLHGQRMTRLFGSAKRLFAETRYLLAAKKCEEILKIDPRNEEVAAFRDKCNDAQVAHDVVSYEKSKKVQTDATWREVRKLAIPYPKVQPLYPADWDEKRKRTAGVSIEAESEEEQKWKQKLNQVLDSEVSFDFIATPLDDVVAFLRSLKKVNIVIDKASLADRAGGLDVTLKLEKVKFRDALEWVLRLLNLKYTLENGAVYISTTEKINSAQKVVTRYYDVTDLTVEIRNFKPNIRAISNTDIDDEDADDIFAEDDDDDGDEKDVFTGESLVEFIKSVISPGTWDEVVGGGDDLPL
jgi:tetratricopeptide (TPR) repeat protein